MSTTRSGRGLFAIAGVLFGRTAENRAEPSTVEIDASVNLPQRLEALTFVLEARGIHMTVSELATSALETFVDSLEAEYSTEIDMVTSMTRLSEDLERREVWPSSRGTKQGRRSGWASRS